MQPRFSRRFIATHVRLAWGWEGEGLNFFRDPYLVRLCVSANNEFFEKQLLREVVVECQNQQPVLLYS